MTEPAFRIRPITLENEFVRLEPLHPMHAPDLFMAGRQHPKLEFQPAPPFDQAIDAVKWITQALDSQLAGTRYPFAIIRPSDNAAMGSTSLFDIRPAEHAVEIGYTWLSPEVQRTPVNTAAKLLLLSHCFDTLEAQRVQLKTDARNLVSQRAIERLGAVREGVLRRHQRLPDGFIRDSFFYSILADEWPSIKARLPDRLASD